MRNRTIQVASLLLVGMLSPIVLAQDKSKQDDKTKAGVQTTPIKVQIIFTEFDGDKKTKSLPYALYMNALDAPDLKSPGGEAKMRIGIQVPMLLDNNKVEYQDVGTNIDARSAYLGDGHVLLQMTFERSWIDGNVSVPVAKSDVPQPDSSNGHFQEPVIRAFKSAFELNLREGQPVESTTAADPLTGKVAKVEISFTVVK